MLLDRYLHDSAQRHPDKLALVCGERRACYAEVEQGANALAHGLRALGLQRQQRVAVYFDNSVETVQGIFATLKAAGVFLVVHPQTKGDKLAFILNDSNVRVLLTDLCNFEAVASDLAACADLHDVVLFDWDAKQPVPPAAAAWAAAGRRLHSASGLLAQQPATLPVNRNISLDLASLVYTSGSTGLPKGVTLTHANMVAAATSITTYLRNEPDDIILSPLPLAFDYGLYQVLMAFRVGATVVLEKQCVYPYKYIELIVKERVTGLPIVYTISSILLNLNDLEEHDFSSVRYITNTAQALPERHITRMRALMPRARIYLMYGLTECKRVAYLPPELIDSKPTSVGNPIPDTEAWIEDESGAVIARQDADGHLYFISRRDDLIKTAGERVGPREVENVLYELDAVKEAAVIGIPDETLGSAIKAFVALREGMMLTEAEVIKHCQKRLERFRVPKQVAFVAELPKTSSGKISKKGLS